MLNYLIHCFSLTLTFIQVVITIFVLQVRNIRLKKSSDFPKVIQVVNDTFGSLIQLYGNVKLT